MTQMQRSSQQIERALERVKIIQRGAGTLVRPLLPPLCPFRENGKPCSSASSAYFHREAWQPLIIWLRTHKNPIAQCLHLWYPCRWLLACRLI